jgi:hypothetical protein
MKFGPETKAIDYLMKLAFHPYMDHEKRSPDASWASVLLQTGPEGRGRLELKLN